MDMSLGGTDAAASADFDRLEALVRGGLACAVFSADAVSGVLQTHPAETPSELYRVVLDCTSRRQVLVAAASLTADGPQTLVVQPLTPEGVQVVAQAYLSYVGGLLSARDKHRFTRERIVH